MQELQIEKSAGVSMVIGGGKSISRAWIVNLRVVAGAAAVIPNRARVRGLRVLAALAGRLGLQLR